MDKFAKLRFHEFAKIAAAATVSGVLALHPGPASAATGSVQVTAGKAKWFVNTNITFSTTSSAWGFSEASLHTTAGTRHDAVDGALSWHVNPAAYAYGSLSPNGYKSPGGTVDITNTSAYSSVTGTTQSLQGLNVSGQMYFLTGKAVVRSILNLQNPTSAPITVSVLSASNLGSDANTVVQSTSSGDNVFDAADNWFVSSETATPTTTNDPILTFAFQGPGSTARGTNISSFRSGTDKFYETFNVTVPANSTRSVMIFVQMSGTVAGAQTDTAAFANAQSLLSAGYLAGLTGAQMAQIVNWNVPPPTPTLAWTTPTSITYGTPLGATQLNATASYNSSPVAGTFTYTPPAGTILNAGPNQALSATFVPTDTTNYTTPSSPVTTTITVLQASTTTTVAPPPATVGSPATIVPNVAVAPPGAGTPTGTVTVADTTDGLSCSYSLGAATPGCTITPPSAGTKNLTVTYSGDTNFTGSTGTGSLTVGAAATGTALTSSLNPSMFGQTVVFTATVTPAAGAPMPTGKVNFGDGTSLVFCGGVTLSAGKATCATSILSVGSHSIQANYGGDANTTASSTTLSQTVNAAATTMSLVASPSTLLSGQSLLLTATVSTDIVPTSTGRAEAGAAARPAMVSAAAASSPTGLVPSGTVTFLDGATTLGSSALGPLGVATLNVSTLSVGTHTLTANFTGNGSFASATAAATVVVNPSSPPVQAPMASRWMLALLGFGLLGVGMRRVRAGRH